jgi:pyruvate formate lyase activating enzyme
MLQGRGPLGGSPPALLSCPTPRLCSWGPARLGSWPGRLAATAFVGAGDDRVAESPGADHGPGGPAGAWVGLSLYLESTRRWTDGIVVRGSEPTADPDLPSLLAAFAERGFPVCLRTDGTRPDVVRHLVSEQLVAAVSVEIRSTEDGHAAAIGRPDAARGVSETLRAILAGHVEHEFRTLVDAGSVTADELPCIARGLKGARLFVIERSRSAGPKAAGRTSIEDLRVVARACSVHLPTVVREVA